MMISIDESPQSAFDPALHRIVGHGVERFPRSFVFGAFLLQPERQLLLNGRTPVRIGGRALDILTALIERPGELVSKQALMARVWPDTFVEEANLKANVANLRRLLGERHTAPRFIATIVGRGYRFIGPVRAFAAGNS
jgi:DNA-binding winged helix-turn-helix (wHTH) protein